MKRWAVFTVVVVAVSVCIVGSYAGIDLNSSVPRPGTLGLQPPSPSTDQSAPMAMPVYGAPPDSGPAPLDQNVVYAAIKAHPGLDKQLEQVGRGSRTEVEEWRRLQENLASTTAADNRSRLAREVQKQVAQELGLLRQIAEEEGAKKTVAAIDGVLMYRQYRLEKLNEQMQADRRNARTNATTTRSSRSRRSQNGGGSTGTEPRGRYAPSSRGTEGGAGGVEEEPVTPPTQGRR